ncbi:MAG: tRNA (N6-threonylcarbamoyladenosine(37)-N6)-methyltransferase TrmO [Deltaproteobacteria bacterium]|nr:tRNA (N6-threonylcarbamoyladenosine(37)-N6)-methyltransferase TrmO [Deltaproteobacteria bacterium]
MNRIPFIAIGRVSSPVTEKTDENWGGVVSRILLEPEFSGGLLGLKDFSHAIVVTYLHEARYERERHLQRRPRGLVEMPKVGIFSQRAKDRPNPIGITAVKIMGVGDSCLEVQGLDAVDGTPVLDIKPYVPQFDRVEKPVVPEWTDRLMKGYF